jgi:hypothetical protein
MITKFTIAILNSMLHHLLCQSLEKSYICTRRKYPYTMVLPFLYLLFIFNFALFLVTHLLYVSATVCLSLLERFCTIVRTSVLVHCLMVTGLISSHPDSFSNSTVCLGLEDFRLWCF